jgi:hypothetical protein
MGYISRDITLRNSPMSIYNQDDAIGFDSAERN